MVQRKSLGRAVLLVALVACVDQAFGPGSQEPVSLSVSVTLPAATPAAWAPVGETLHVTVRRAGRIEPVVDTSVAITAALTMALDVPLAQAVERFVATAEVRYGTSLLFLAFDIVQLRAGTDTAVTFSAQYVGPGAGATSYTLGARDSTLLQGDTASLVPQVHDSLGRPIPNVPVRYVASRPALVTVDSGGLLSALTGTLDTARVTGYLPMGLSSALVVAVISSAASPPRRRTWVGGAAGAATDWFRADNWSPAGDPGAGDTIEIADTGNDPVLAGRDTITAIIITGGALAMGRGTLLVLGDLSTAGGSAGGALTMTHADDTVRVLGDAVFGGRIAAGMSDGVLLVGGDLDVPDLGGPFGFEARDGHRTVLDGAQPQRLAVGAGNTGAAFRHLEIANTAGRVLIGAGDRIAVTGILRISTATTIDDGSGGNGNVNLEVEDSLVMAAGSRLTVAELGLSGAMAVAGAFAPQAGGAFQVRFFGADRAVQAGLDYRDVEINGTARLTGPTTFTGDLNVFGSLDLAGQALVVTGHLHTENGDGRLIMQRPADRLEVRGDATFEGDSIAGDLTDGTLRVAGTFRQLRYSNTRNTYRAAGNHRTVLDGATRQDVVLADETTFGHLEIANTGGAVGIAASRITTAGTLRLSTPVQVVETGSEPTLELDIGDTLSLATGSTLAAAVIVARGPLAVAGTIDAGQVEFAGTDQAIPSQLAYRSVAVTGSARLVGRTVIANGVWLHGPRATLTLGGHTLQSSGITTGTGAGGAVDTSTLVMQQPTDSLIVDGDAAFGSIAMPGSLSAGVLVVRSNTGGGLFQYATPLAFQPAGSHRTVLAGAAVQARFDSTGSGAAGSYFRHLTLGDSSVVYLQRLVTVTGTLSGGSGLAPPVVTRANATATMIAAGGSDVAGLILRGVTLEVGDGLVRLDSVTFDQQDPAATQLSIRHPGAAGAFTLTGLRFLTTPTSGAYVSASDAAPSDGQVLTIDLASSSPVDGSAHTLTSGGAVVNWTGASLFLGFGGGAGQTGPPGQPLADSMIVMAYDLGEGPLAGVVISFRAASGGGSVSPESVTTDANGRAAARWTLGPGAGEQVLEAVAAGAAPVQATAMGSSSFASMEIVRGDGQEGLPSAVLPDSLVIRVLDASAQPVAGVVVDFWSLSGGSVSPARVITGASGVASTQLTLGTSLGADAVTAYAYRNAGAETLTFTARIGNTGFMTTNRFEHQATVLLDGSVLVTGGYANFSATPITATAERYDAPSRTFAPTGAMAQPRWDHTATLLADGRVLVAGGGYNSSPFPAVASAELYDPVSGTFAPAGTMIGCTFTVACGGMRRNHTATRLLDGRVLIAGGHFTVGNSLGALDVAELYDPANGTFTQTVGRMTWQHSFHTATLLADGRVLITGGELSPFSGAIDIASTFSPTTGTFTATGPMTRVRNRHTATRLLDGRVLVVGGFSADADLFDPATNTFTTTGAMQAPRIWHEATLLPDGRVLITGGQSGNTRLATTEIYDPATGTFTRGPDMLSVRSAHQAVLVGTRVLLIGGVGSGGGPVSTAELFPP